jgi:hypothetical protein
VIPGNDDAIRSGALMCRVMAEAVIEGRWVAEHRPKPPAPPASAAAPGQRRPPRGPRAPIGSDNPEPPAPPEASAAPAESTPAESAPAESAPAESTPSEPASGAHPETDVPVITDSTPPTDES